MPAEHATCRRCSAILQTRERPEGVCDHCLIDSSWRPGRFREPPFHDAGPDIQRLGNTPEFAEQLERVHRA